MSEQANATPSACQHPEAAGARWGDPIAPERQAELRHILDTWMSPNVDHTDLRGPFDKEPGALQGFVLTGADVYWLAERVRNQRGEVPELHLEGADLRQAHLEAAALNEARLTGVDLTDAHLAGTSLHKVRLEGAQLRRAHLERATLIGAQLERALLSGAHLQGADLSGAHLQGADLTFAHAEQVIFGEARLERADLSRAHLEGAGFREAHLEEAIFYEAQLERADLSLAHLEGARLFGTDLRGVDLTAAWLDSKTVLNHAALDQRSTLGNIHWSGIGAVDLTSIDWASVPTLGDEHGVELRADVAAHEGVVRAYRQLAAQLRAQGMSEVADRFLYRAQVLQRRVLLKQRHFGRWFGSLLLDLIAGHGYKPLRSALTYVLVVAVFAMAYLVLGSKHGALSWNEALVVSMTAFHGRGFFGSAFQPGDPQAAVAAIEALIGLLIEITFIATFTQRFFAR